MLRCVRSRFASERIHVWDRPQQSHPGPISFSVDQLDRKDACIVAVGFLKYCYLAFFSNPAADRQVYRHLAKKQPRRVLEIGMGDAQRTVRMLDVLVTPGSETEVVYTGIDRFEARTEAPALTLKDAYKITKRDGVKAKLVPGDALSAMTVTANAAANTDFILIDSAIQDEDLQQAWKYFPRMMHEHTLVLRQIKGDDDKITVQSLSLAEIEKRAQAVESARVAA